MAVIVSSGGQDQRVEIGIGAPCAGSALTPITSTGS
jgi:hypothetical protein